MALSENERSVLGVVQHQAHAPLSAIRKVLKIKDHAIRYSINQLRDKGAIVSSIPFIDIYQLGYLDHTLYFSIVSDGRRTTSKLDDFLTNHKSVSWVARLSGEYHYGVSVMSRGIDGVHLFLEELSTRFGSVIFSKEYSVRIEFFAFGRKYLCPPGYLPPVLRFGVSKGPVFEIDKLSSSILGVMSNKALESNREVARRIGAPSSTVEARIKDLENKKVIAGYIYRLKSRVLGMNSFKLLLYSRGPRKEFVEQLKKFVSTHPLVTNFSVCLGVWDYELTVDVSYAEEIMTIIEELHEKFPGDILRVRPVIVQKSLKFSNFPFEG